VIGVFAGLKLAVHVVVNLITPYEFHRDELLYLAMGRHLRLWAMDFPPAIALLAEGARAVGGDSLVAIRMVPALAGTALVILAALLARELGGGWRAQALACLCVLANPLFLRSANLFQPVVLDQVTWTLALLALARLLGGYGPGSWLVLGLALGVGLLVKFSIGVIGVAIVLAILLSRLRGALRTPWPWAALLIALTVGSPSLVGQIRLGFPVMSQLADLGTTQLERITPVDFLLGQILWGPSTLLALAGLAGLFWSPRLESFRALGIACLGTFGILLALQGKPYYIGPVYPLLFAAGAVQVEALGESATAEFVNWGTVTVLVGYGLLISPLGLPYLLPQQMSIYAQSLGIAEAVRTNTGEMGELPQDYADMIGWKEQAEAVARVYNGLPANQRAEAVILAGNYGEAGALELYGPRYRLPPPVSAAGSYWFFGPGPRPGRVVLAIGIDPAVLAPEFHSVREVGRVGDRWAVAEERDVPITLAMGPRRTLQEVWPSLGPRSGAGAGAARR
jgi:4-amino-4-deoxy-L-arabinose transferase-like glycosyltransferase